MNSISNLLPLLKNKYVEISVGDEYEEIIFSDHIQKVNGVIYGEIKDTIGDFLVINCFYLDKQGQLRQNNTVYINSWNIRAITEMTSENTGLNSVLLSASHNKKIRKHLGLDNDS